jgi:hypothetical protein
MNKIWERKNVLQWGIEPGASWKTVFHYTDWATLHLILNAQYLDVESSNLLFACRQSSMHKLKCPQCIRLNSLITILRGPLGPSKNQGYKSYFYFNPIFIDSMIQWLTLMVGSLVGLIYLYCFTSILIMKTLPFYMYAGNTDNAQRFWLFGTEKVGVLVSFEGSPPSLCRVRQTGVSDPRLNPNLTVSYDGLQFIYSFSMATYSFFFSDDHSRVVLEVGKEFSSDYINANFIEVGQFQLYIRSDENNYFYKIILIVIIISITLSFTRNSIFCRIWKENANILHRKVRW